VGEQLLIINPPSLGLPPKGREAPETWWAQNKMTTYKTFLRSARNFEEFSSAEKIEQETGLNFAEARTACQEYNHNRTEAEIEAGTKMEFAEE
jgi:hypothetical protein